MISLNREFAHPDITTYHVAFDDNNHVITINKPIEINSLEKDSIVAVANYLEKNPELKMRVMQTDPNLIGKATVIKQELQVNKLRLREFQLRQMNRNHKHVACVSAFPPES